MDGADSLAKSERRAATLIQTEDRNLCFSVTATKLFELSGLHKVEEKVWRL